AARIEPLAKHGGICLSEDVARQIRNKIKLPILERGKSELKNIQLPVNIYEIHLPWEKISRIRLLLLPWRRVVGTLAALLVVVGVAWFVWRRAGEQKPPPLELTFNGAKMKEEGLCFQGRSARKSVRTLHFVLDAGPVSGVKRNRCHRL